MAWAVPSWGAGCGQDYSFLGDGEQAIAAPAGGDSKSSKSKKKAEKQLQEALEQRVSLSALTETSAKKGKAGNANLSPGEDPIEEGVNAKQKGKKKRKKLLGDGGAADAEQPQSSTVDVEVVVGGAGGGEGAVPQKKGKKSKNKFKAALEREEEVGEGGAAVVGEPLQQAAASDDPPKRKAKNKNKFKQNVEAAAAAADTGNDKGASAAPAAASAVRAEVKSPAVVHKGGKQKGGGLLEQMRAKLQGGHFRWLNETLYTQPGQESFQMMQEQPEMFTQYHEGFRQQTLGWPKLPVDVAISWLKGRPASLVVADFGCGDAQLEAEVKQKVFSLDLVSQKPNVIACDMAATPLEDASVDVAVFCLALMGTNYPLFLKEAARVLKQGGTLWIAEVRSRFSEGALNEIQGMKAFVTSLKKLGFVLQNKDASNKMFVILELTKRSDPNEDVRVQWPTLKACTYKRR